MITLPVQALFVLQALLPLIFILGLWFYYRLRESSRLGAPRDERIYRCQICSHVYVDSRDVPLSRCPRCDTLNEPVRG